MSNKELAVARDGKKDEFYTQLVDIEKEMYAYIEKAPDIFKDSVILLPCDNPQWSSFTTFFVTHFRELGVKKLISTSYTPVLSAMEKGSLFDLLPNNPAPGRGEFLILERVEENGREEVTETSGLLEGDGDFRSVEVTKFRDEANFVITNPPFSLFREFIEWVNRPHLSFSVMGSMNAVTYKEIFPLFKDNKVWYGPTITGGDREFRIPDDYPANATTSRVDKDGVKYLRIKGVRWFTNIDHGKANPPLELSTMEENRKSNPKVFTSPVAYKKYDNYDAIEVPSTKAIPSDYQGVMGVPISFLDKYCPEQFEILGSRRWAKSQALLDVYTGDVVPPEKDKKVTIEGKEVYDRVFIRFR